ncbi:MAG TPA: flagellar motor protein MotD [Rhodanobacter sp.]|nr:flagellar motor protein MotD [Rhodanobacter sp.]
MRRKRHEDHVNHEAWAIPYADLMTLLLAFFVVMYAVSVVNVGKYRVMSASMTDAFNGHPGVIVPQAPEGGQKEAPAAVRPSTAVPIPLPIQRPRQEEARKSAPESLERIEDQVRRALQPMIDKQLVVLRRTPDRLEIEIRTDILFSSGAAQLSASASQVLSSVATILVPFKNALRVEGFTDNVPIRTAVYPSNWELSAARAASVARLFGSIGVSADRLGIVGWGDQRPVADNSTDEGRNHNRRILVVVEGARNGGSRIQSDIDDLAPASKAVAQAPTRATAEYGAAELPAPESQGAAIVAASPGQETARQAQASLPQSPRILPQTITVHPANDADTIHGLDPVHPAPAAFSARNTYAQDASIRRNP